MNGKHIVLLECMLEKISDEKIDNITHGMAILDFCPTLEFRGLLDLIATENELDPDIIKVQSNEASIIELYNAISGLNSPTDRLT